VSHFLTISSPLPSPGVSTALHSTTTSTVSSTSGAVKYRKLKTSGYIPDSFSPVASGGYNKVFKLSEDPKGYLMEALRLTYAGSTDDIESATANSAMDVKTCIDLLAGESKGWDSEKVEGEVRLSEERSDDLVLHSYITKNLLLVTLLLATVDARVLCELEEIPFAPEAYWQDREGEKGRGAKRRPCTAWAQ